MRRHPPRQARRSSSTFCSAFSAWPSFLWRLASRQRRRWGRSPIDSSAIGPSSRSWAPRCSWGLQSASRPFSQSISGGRMLTRIFVAVLLVVGAGVAAVGARGADPPAAPTITVGPDNPTNSQTAVFEWAVQEGLTYQCELDSGGFSSCTSPYLSDPLPEAIHVFQVKAVDSSAIESEPATYTWTIDLTAPATSIVSHPANPSNDVSPHFDFASSEVGSTFECKIDSAGFASCESPKSVTVSAGTHTFSVRATDEASNLDLTPASYSWTVDTTAPATPVLRSPRPDDPSNDPTPKFRWDTVLGVTYVCSVDGISEACVPTYETDPLSEGMHTFEVQAKDTAGNLSAPATWTWTTDF